MPYETYVRQKKDLLTDNERLVLLTDRLSRRLLKHAKNCRFTKLGKNVKKSIMNECEDHLQSLVGIQNYLVYLKRISNSSEENGKKI